MSKKLSSSRPARWERACAAARDALEKTRSAYEDLETAMEELRGLQEEYADWQSNLPENLQQSAIGEKLDAIAGLALEPNVSDELDQVESAIDEAEGLDLPRGFGRD
jgi:phage shock protein A